jgi:hypothetical protein
MQTINRNSLLEAIQKADGSLFSIIFIKKDGSLREMVARTGVTKGVNGAGLKFDPKARGLLPVYDMHKDAWRMVNLNTVKAIKLKKNQYVVVD